MLTILLNPNRSEPLYQQICAAIREEIASGALRQMEKAAVQANAFGAFADQHCHCADCI